MSSNLPLWIVLIGWIVAASPVVARAAFEIVSHEVVVDVPARQTTFTLTFNQPPDFFSVNELDQPKNAFQFFYDADPSTDGEVDFTGEDVVIVRGPEIRVDNRIPIRDSLNPTGEEFPNAEGWGKSLAEVDFELEGQTLSFTTGWDELRDDDGTSFGYHLFALEGGELTGEFTRVSNILVPMQPTTLGALALLPFAAVAVRRFGRR
jgi:hypothetical protein